MMALITSGCWRHGNGTDGGGALTREFCADLLRDFPELCRRQLRALRAQPEVIRAIVAEGQSMLLHGLWALPPGAARRQSRDDATLSNLAAFHLFGCACCRTRVEVPQQWSQRVSVRIELQAAQRMAGDL